MFVTNNKNPEASCATPRGVYCLCDFPPYLGTDCLKTKL